jgi:hypothetical protein
MIDLRAHVLVLDQIRATIRAEAMVGLDRFTAPVAEVHGTHPGIAHVTCR